jgi:hypothetical protein
MWKLLFRVSGGLLSIFAVALLTLPKGSGWKSLAGLMCAFLGTVCVVSMFFARETGKEAEIHVVNRELDGRDHGGDGDGH